MALPDSAKWTTGTAIVFADSTDHSPSAANNLGTRTVQIDCTDLAAGAARQSDKFDFGENWDLTLTLASCVEWETSPEVTAGEGLDFYLGFSNSATAGVANPAGLSGSDGAYTGYSAGSLAQSLENLYPLNSHIMDNVINTDQAQIDMAVSTFTPLMRYGILVVYNAAASAALHSDMVETSFAFLPGTLRIID